MRITATSSGHCAARRRRRCATSSLVRQRWDGSGRRRRRRVVRRASEPFCMRARVVAALALALLAGVVGAALGANPGDEQAKQQLDARIGALRADIEHTGPREGVLTARL